MNILPLSSQSANSSFFTNFCRGVKTLLKVAAVALVALPMASSLPQKKLSSYLGRFPLIGHQYLLEGRLSCPFTTAKEATIFSCVHKVRTTPIEKRTQWPCYEQEGFMFHNDTSLFSAYNLALKKLSDAAPPRDRVTLVNQICSVGKILSKSEICSLRTSELMLPLKPRAQVQKQNVYDYLMTVKNEVVSYEDLLEIQQISQTVGMLFAIPSQLVSRELNALAINFEQGLRSNEDPILTAAKIHTGLFQIAPFALPARTDMLAQLFTNVVLSRIGGHDSIIHPNGTEYLESTYQSIVQKNCSIFADYLRKTITWVSAHKAFLK